MVKTRAMNMLYPEPTRYDLNFRFFGIPVRVTPWFWLVLAVLGAAFGGLGLLAAGPALAFLLFTLAILLGFLSIFIHELGHVLMGACYGARGEIVLTAVGGLAGGCSDVHLRAHRIMVCLAGPIAQLL